jgi:hypothetical protein
VLGRGDGWLHRRWRWGEGGRCGGLRPGSSSGGLGTMKGTTSSGSVRRVTAVWIDSHGGEARSEEWLTEELEVAMAERRPRRASSGGWRDERVGKRIAAWERRRQLRQARPTSSMMARHGLEQSLGMDASPTQKRAAEDGAMSTSRAGKRVTAWERRRQLGPARQRLDRRVRRRQGTA